MRISAWTWWSCSPGDGSENIEDGEILYKQPTPLWYYRIRRNVGSVRTDGSHRGQRFVRMTGTFCFGQEKDLVRLTGDTLAQSIETGEVQPILRMHGYCRLKGSTHRLIVMDYNSVGKWAGERRVPYSTFAELAQRPEVYELVKKDIDRVNSTLSSALRIRKYVLLHREFDPDEGELTRTGD
jgi:hypothetical protein